MDLQPHENSFGELAKRNETRPLAFQGKYIQQLAPYLVPGIVINKNNVQPTMKLIDCACLFICTEQVNENTK